MRSSVSSRSCSRTRPSEYVFPEPDWPHRNVCRSKPPASSAKGTPGASTSSPTSSAARAGRVRSSQAATSAGSRGPGSGVVERRAVALEHDALALGVAQEDARVDGDVVGERDRQVGALAAGRLQGDQLPEPRLAPVLEHDVAAGLEGEVVQRRLEREPPPVHRGRERDDRPLEVAPQVPVARRAGLELVGRRRHADLPALVDEHVEAGLALLELDRAGVVEHLVAGDDALAVRRLHAPPDARGAVAEALVQRVLEGEAAAEATAEAR